MTLLIFPLRFSSKEAEAEFTAEIQDLLATLWMGSGFLSGPTSPVSYLPHSPTAGPVTGGVTDHLFNTPKSIVPPLS